MSSGDKFLLKPTREKKEIFLSANGGHVKNLPGGDRYLRLGHVGTLHFSGSGGPSGHHGSSGCPKKGKCVEMVFEGLSANKKPIRFGGPKNS